MTGASSPAGFYGKLPMLGDFVSRRVTRAFVDPWDRWLQQCMAASRELLAEAWLQRYLNSPLWRYVLCGTVCGPQPRIGVLMPSVDRVGRYFPLTVTRSVTGYATPWSMVSAAGDWFERAEDVALAALQSTEDGVDGYDALVQGLRPIPPGSGPAEPPGQDRAGEGRAWRRCLSEDQALGNLFPVDLMEAADRELAGPLTVWWSAGAEGAPPSLLICEGLPAPGRFAAMLDGNWPRDGWEARDRSGMEAEGARAGEESDLAGSGEVSQPGVDEGPGEDDEDRTVPMRGQS